MSRSQFRRIWLILRLAWLNLQEESICYWQDQPVNYVPSDAAASSCAFRCVRFIRTDCSVDASQLSAPTMRRFRRRLVCFSITCNPLIVHDQQTSRKTSSQFSHALLWCRLEWKRVSQLPQTRTCAQAIDIQYHSDKDTTTLSFAESGKAFGCLLALRQPNVIIETVCHERSEKSLVRRFLI